MGTVWGVTIRNMSNPRPLKEATSLDFDCDPSGGSKILEGLDGEDNRAELDLLTLTIFLE